MNHLRFLNLKRRNEELQHQQQQHHQQLHQQHQQQQIQQAPPQPQPSGLSQSHNAVHNTMNSNDERNGWGRILSRSWYNTQFNNTQANVKEFINDKVYLKIVEKKKMGFSVLRQISKSMLISIIKNLSTIIIDIRGFKEYRKLHLRTAINMDASSLKLPNKQDVEVQMQGENQNAYFDNFQLLISESDRAENHHCFDKIEMLYKSNKNMYPNMNDVFHIVLYGDAGISKSNIILPFIHLLHDRFRDDCRSGRLKISVISKGFPALEGHIDENLLKSVTEFRQSQFYNNSIETDDKVHTEVLPHLFITSIIGATDKELLLKNKITTIINVTENKDVQYPEIDYLTTHHIHMLDIGTQLIDEPIRQAYEIIENEKHSGRVLVHCSRGQSRSVVIVLGYLILSRQWSTLRSFIYLLHFRPWIGPNLTFMYRLFLFEYNLSSYKNFAPVPFPLRIYYLFQTGDEDFIENIAFFGILPIAQPIFKTIDEGHFRELMMDVQQQPLLKYERHLLTDEAPIHRLLEKYFTNSQPIRDDVIERLIILLLDEHVIDEYSIYSETPLLLAAKYSGHGVMDLLLSKGANPCVVSMSGKNPIHRIAVCCESATQDSVIAIAKKCLHPKYNNYHFKFITFDSYGLTPIDYAYRASYFSFMRLLQKRLIEELYECFDPSLNDSLSIHEAALVAFTVASVINTRRVYEAYFSSGFANETHAIAADRFPQFFSNYELSKYHVSGDVNDIPLKYKESPHAGKWFAELQVVTKILHENSLNLKSKFEEILKKIECALNGTSVPLSVNNLTTLINNDDFIYST